MDSQVPIDPAARAPETVEDGVREVLPDLAYQRLAIVNASFFGVAGAGPGEWVLVDAGIAGTAPLIARAAAERFGADSRPLAIILTHGHFDHVGALPELSERWDVPIYAHPLEHPFLDGHAAYPPPDPTVGGGMMATLSPLYPRGPVNISRWLQPLPADGSVPGMPGWSWLLAPGHTPGQVALWRESDRTLLSADAFITTRQESAYAVATQAPELHGPPMYYTQDWEAARESVRMLAALEPELVVSGHGRAMAGEPMREALRTLARDFDEIAVPHQGRYVDDPARVDDPDRAYAPPER